ncbi:MAG: TetR/AcrR family transcriptional regulator [Lachnospiraceae bacterium]
MSVSDSSIDPKILKSAKEEFLQKGFANASLREICRKAGVTTGALYKRFSGKEELFAAVLNPTIKDIQALKQSVEQNNYQHLERQEMQLIWNMSEETHKGWIEFLYARYDGFKLLLCCSEGSSYSTFLNDFVMENTKHTMSFIEKAFSSGLTKNQVDQDELHILLTAYWSTLFETIVHDFPKEKALHHCDIITKFFNWQAVLGF